MNITKDQLALVANTIRMLSADGVEKANSGHPGMGMAELATVLWLKYLNFNPKQPNWINRDRFVLSNGHGCMLLYSMLHLSGYDVSLEDLKNFRQWDSKTPGHPEFHFTPGVEATTGPLGQGIANAVGMAIAENIMAARFEDGPINHRVFAFAGDGCMQEGVSGEASSMAGHLGLGNLTVIYDDNHISIAGPTGLSFSEDVTKRYEAYGWHVQRIDGHDFDAIDQALEAATKITDRPTLIAARTTIGKGAPHKANDAEVHGAPLGKEEMANTRKALDWPEEMFHIPANTLKIFAARILEQTEKYSAWEDSFKSWKSKNVVSMPCVEQFHAQSLEYQSNLIPRFVQKVVIEAGTTLGWRDAIDGTREDTRVIGIDRYGASAPAKVIADKLGFTPEQVVERVRERFFKASN